MSSVELPLVTIGIPTYNRANTYLPGALESARNQTYPNLEIVVCDNGSTDKTEEIVEGFDDSRIRYIRHTTNIGANANFNSCLDNARGDLFLLLHDDDRIDSDFVESCLSAADYRTDLGIIRTGTRIIDASGERLREIPNPVAGMTTLEFFQAWFAHKTSLYLCSTLFNTAELVRIGGFKSKHNLFQDVVAEVTLAARFGRVDVEAVKASFRKHSGEITFSAKLRDWCEDSLFLLDAICKLLPEHEDLLRREGLRFFVDFNYRLAHAVGTPLNRLFAFLVVYKCFGFQYLPRSFWRFVRKG